MHEQRNELLTKLSQSRGTTQRQRLLKQLWKLEREDARLAAAEAEAAETGCAALREHATV